MHLVLKLLGISAALALAIAAPVQAQSITENLAYAPSFSTGGWTIQLGSCSMADGSGQAATCATTEFVTASVSGTVLSLVFSGTEGGTTSTNGTDFLYDNGTGTGTDLSVDVTVTSPTGETIWLAGDSLNTGATTTGLAGTVSAEEGFQNPTEPVVLNSDLSNNPGGGKTVTSPILTSETFAPTTATITAVNDFSSGSGNGTAAVPTIKLTFNAPEPVSLSLLAIGIAGLGFVRRKIRRTT